MRKVISAALSFLLVFSSGCASVRVSGKPFCNADRLDELTAYLDQGINKITKRDLQNFVAGSPEMFTDKDSERWIYKFSQTKSKFRSGFTYSERIDRTTANELEVIFDKKGVLKSYRMTNQKSENSEQNNYAYQLGQGFMAGVIGAIVYVVINEIKGAITKK